MSYPDMTEYAYIKNYQMSLTKEKINEYRRQISICKKYNFKTNLNDKVETFLVYGFKDVLIRLDSILEDYPFNYIYLESISIKGKTLTFNFGT